METGIEVGGGSRLRRRWTASEKRRIVEDTLSSTRSLASLARQHGVNANQLFSWRKPYHAGQLCEDQFAEPARRVQLLPVSRNAMKSPIWFLQRLSRGLFTSAPGGQVAEVFRERIEHKWR